VNRYPSLPYVIPFAVFLGLLALMNQLPKWGIVLGGLTDQLVRVAVMLTVLWFVARPVIDLRVRHGWGSLLVGVGVFVLWIAPDAVFPGYRHHWLFENPLFGPSTTLDPASRTNSAVLALRTFRAMAIVPIVEELFWRAWLMRWVIAPDFRSVPLGAWSQLSFWSVAVLFASEHGAYWDVGLMAGVVYNWWMLRTKSLGDLIATHAVTNACLSAYLMAAGKWEYWS
jgi:CAAX prenyl protease-like protein